MTKVRVYICKWCEKEFSIPLDIMFSIIETVICPICYSKDVLALYDFDTLAAIRIKEIGTLSELSDIKFNVLDRGSCDEDKGKD